MSQSQLTHITSQPERDRRYAELRAMMADNDLGALVICSRGDEFVRGRVQYVSDIFQWAGRGFVVLPATGEAVFIVDPLWGLGYAMRSGWLNDYRVPDNAGDEIGSIISDLGLKSGQIGVVGLADITAVADFESMKKALPDATFNDATDLFDDIRAIKSEEELDNVRETSDMLRTAFQALEAQIRPGVREIDVLAEAHRLCRQLGGMEGIALMGRPPFNSFSPGGSGGVIEKDDVIVIDLEWGGPSGYWVELRRVYSFAPPTSKQQKYWESRVESFAACVDAMKTGQSSTTVLDARDAVYKKYGQHADGVIAYTAHGIGVDSLEPPWVPGKDRIMQENMLINLHPAIKFDDPDEGLALGGISIADNVIVTKDGGVRTTDQEDHWIVLG
ncbi:MAG: M24 family metallopeptidase [Acidimicrobiia bacterium]|nr:M24 family metallopeptidase [Acidimicrobiia bacterium]MDH3463145.1 M24 family metallopeptidase [Acidimicrobiia bacterium]